MPCSWPQKQCLQVSSHCPKPAITLDSRTSVPSRRGPPPSPPAGAIVSWETNCLLNWWRDEDFSRGTSQKQNWDNGQPDHSLTGRTRIEWSLVNCGTFAIHNRVKLQSPAGVFIGKSPLVSWSNLPLLQGIRWSRRSPTFLEGNYPF
jgi:hypothetical protein